MSGVDEDDKPIEKKQLKKMTSSMNNQYLIRKNKLERKLTKTFERLTFKHQPIPSRHILICEDSSGKLKCYFDCEKTHDELPKPFCWTASTPDHTAKPKQTNDKAKKVKELVVNQRESNAQKKQSIIQKKMTFYKGSDSGSCSSSSSSSQSFSSKSNSGQENSYSESGSGSDSRSGSGSSYRSDEGSNSEGEDSSSKKLDGKQQDSNKKTDKQINILKVPYKEDDFDTQGGISIQSGPPKAKKIDKNVVVPIHQNKLGQLGQIGIGAHSKHPPVAETNSVVEEAKILVNTNKENIHSRQLIEFSPSILMKNSSKKSAEHKATKETYGDFLELIEEITIENCTITNIFESFKLPTTIKILRLFNSVFDLLPAKEYIHQCRRSIEHVLFMQAIPVTFHSSILSFFSNEKIEVLQRDKAAFVVFQQDFLKIQYLDLIQVIIFDLLDPVSSKALLNSQNKLAYDPALKVDYNRLIHNHYLNRKENLEKIRESDSKRSNDNKKDIYLESLEEGSPEFYNYLFLDMKEEGRMDAEELASFEISRFNEALQTIEKDLERRMQFENYVIGRLQMKKHNQNKKKLRIELIINKFHFEDIASFVYLTNALDLYSSKITTIKFMRLGRIKDNLFNILMTKIREMKRVKILLFYDTALYPQHLEEIKSFMNWKKKVLQKVGFVKNFLNPLDLNFLFDSKQMKYPRTTEQLNDIHSLEHFNVGLAKSYRVIMVKNNFISKTLRKLISKHAKPISKSGIYFNGNLGYDFSLKEGWQDGEIDEETEQIVAQAIENDQIQKLEGGVYAEKIAKLEKTKIIEMETNIFSKKSFNDIDISIGFIDPKRIGEVLSTRAKIGIMSLNIFEDLDEDIKNLRVKDIIVSHLDCVSMYPVEKGYIYPRTLRSIELNVETEDKNIGPGLNVCGPYLENLLITGPYSQQHGNEFSKTFNHVQWSLMTNLRRLQLNDISFLEGQLANLIKQIAHPNLREFNLDRITTTKDSIMAPNWSAFTGLQQISFNCVNFFSPPGDSTELNISLPFEAIAPQITHINIQRLQISGIEYGSYTPQNYQNLQSITFIVTNVKMNQNESLRAQIKDLKDIAALNKQKKNEKGGAIHTVHEEEEEDDDEVAARERKEEEEEVKNRDSHQRKEGEEDIEIDDGAEKRVKELYRMRQKGIIMAGVQQMQEQLKLDYYQTNLSSKVIYESFKRVNVELKNISLFSEHGIPAEFDINLIADNLTSIDLSFMAHSEECLKNFQTYFTRKNFKKVHEIRIREHLDYSRDTDKQLSKLVHNFIPQLTFLDLRGSVMHLKSWFDESHMSQQFMLETLKVSFSFFQDEDLVKKFFDKVSNTLTYLEVDTCVNPELITGNYDFSVLKQLKTFIFFAETTSSSIKSLLTLPESLQVIVLGEEEHIKEIINQLLFKNLPKLEKLTLNIVELCFSDSQEQHFFNENSSKFSNLKEIIFKSINITIQKLTQIFSFQHLQHLQTLDLSHNPLIKGELANISDHSKDSFPIDNDSYATDQSGFYSNADSELDIPSFVLDTNKDNDPNVQTEQVLPTYSTYFQELFNPIQGSLRILILKNSQITQSIFQNVLSSAKLTKLDISSNPQFFEDDSSAFVKLLQTISPTLTDLNMSSTNLNIESHFQGIPLGEKFKQLKILKLKNTPSLTLSSSQTYSQSSIKFLSDVLSTLHHLSISELVPSLDFKLGKHLSSLDLTQLKVQRDSKTSSTGISKVINAIGGQLFKLNISYAHLSEADISETNWKALKVIREFNLSRILVIQENIHLVGTILDPLTTIEEIKLFYDDVEIQFMLIQWEEFLNLKRVQVTGQIYQNIFQFNQNMDLWKGHFENVNKYTTHPLQLLNKRICQRNSPWDIFSIIFREPTSTLTLQQYHFSIEDESIISHETISNPNKTVSFYNMIAWNILRLDFFKQPNFNKLQLCLFENLSATRLPLFYFNNINVYLFFAYSQASDTGFLDLILSDKFLEQEAIDVIMVQSKNIEQLFYIGTSDEGLIDRLRQIQNDYSIQRIILTYSISENRNRIMNQLSKSSTKEDVYDLYQDEDSHTAADSSTKKISHQKSDIEENHLFKLDEGRMLEFFNFSPPQTLQLSNYSVQFFKYLFLILVYAPYSFNTKINYMIDSLPNSSISARLMKGCYTNGNNGYLYKFLRFFYTDPQFYKFDQSVIQFNMQLKNFKKNILLKFMLYSMIPVYYTLCIFCPIYFTWYFDLIDKCGSGLSWVSYYIYAFFAVITLFMEYKLYIQVIDSVSHLIPPAAIPPPTSTLNLLLIQFKKLTNQHRKLLYIFSFVNSQITRYNYFTDIGFIVGSYQCEQIGIMWASIACVGSHTLINFYKYVNQITRKKKKFAIPTSEIDEFSNLSSLIEFHAVYEVLDLISPSNIVVLPVFLRRIRIFKINHLAGVAFNSRIIDAFTRFLVEDLPQLIIQIIFLTKAKSINITIILSLLATIFTIFIQLYKFLSIRPSPVSTLDFEELNNRKKDQFPKFLRKSTQLSKSNDIKIINHISKLSEQPETAEYFKEFITAKSVDQGIQN